MRPAWSFSALTLLFRRGAKRRRLQRLVKRVCGRFHNWQSGWVAAESAETAHRIAPDAAARGVLKVEGRMVERLHLAEALRLIAVAEAIARRSPA